MVHLDRVMLIDQLAHRLSRRSESVVAAESCTGGLVADRLTGKPGSSAWCDGGVVTYTIRQKHVSLGVPMALIQRDGAVSEAVARAMALGALRHSLADYAVAVTGFAGPDSDQAGVPVGTVWFAWAARQAGIGTVTRSQVVQFAGDRADVRSQAADRAIEGFLSVVPEGAR